MLNQKIVVKAGVKQLGLFKESNFSHFEAYLTGEETGEEMELLAGQKIKLLSLHMPSSVKVNGKNVPVNFCDQGGVGEKSLETLKKLINFSNEKKVRFIILHLGFFNVLTEEREAALIRAAGKLNQLDWGEVKLCVENIPCWFNICLEKEPVLSQAEHFFQFRQKCPQIGFVFDVDHLAINTVFQHFYGEIKAEYVKLNESCSVMGLEINAEKTKFMKEKEKEILSLVRNSPDKFRKEINSSITSFLLKIKPDIIHAVGSDPSNYFSFEQLPLVGEALPLNYRGKIQGHKVEDNIDHGNWLSLLPREIWITIELMLRQEYDYLEEIKKSYHQISLFLQQLKEKKVLLIYPPHDEGTMIFSLPCLYSYLKDYAKVEVIDCPGEGIGLGELVARSKKFDPDFIGISIPSTVMANSALRTISVLREVFPKTIIVTGGVHVTLCPEELTPYCHVAVLGEGEKPLRELIQGRKIPEIRSLAYQTEGKIVRTSPAEKTDLDYLPFVDWECIPYQKFNSKYNIACEKRMRYMPLFGSKGCVFNCYFCSNWVISGRRISYKSVDRVIQEIDYLLKKYQAEYLFFADETFTINRKRVIDLCEKIISKNLKFSWTCQTRANLVDAELLALMKIAGCDTISFGIEAGSDELLKKIQKGETKEHMAKGIKLSKEAGMKVYGGFILGHYWDTLQTVWETIKFADQLDLDCPNFHIAVPFPKTQLRELIGNKLSNDYSIYKTNKAVYVPEGLKHVNLQMLRRFAQLYFYVRRPRRIVPLAARRITRLTKRVKILLTPRKNSLASSQ